MTKIKLLIAISLISGGYLCSAQSIGRHSICKIKYPNARPVYSQQELSQKEIQPVLAYCLDIWQRATFDTSNLKIQVMSSPLENDALAITTIGKFFKGIQNSPFPDSWHPVSLAEHIVQKDLNDGLYDLTITLNSEVNWYLGIDGKTPYEKFDLATILLHELAHGFGFLSSASVSNGIGELGINGDVVVFDHIIEGENGTKLSHISTPSETLENFLTKEKLYIQQGSSSIRAQLYTPSVFLANSSLNHFDPGFLDRQGYESFMQPVIAPGYSYHTLEKDTLLMDALRAIGWSRSGYFSGSVFPNPSNGVVNISLDGHIVQRMEVLDLFGKTLNWERLSENQISIKNKGTCVLVMEIDHKKHYKLLIIR
ncbi:MAG: hypothetical protein RIC35_25090 [Marinoscillum sp.]